MDDLFSLANCFGKSVLINVLVFNILINASYLVCYIDLIIYFIIFLDVAKSNLRHY